MGNLVERVMAYQERLKNEQQGMAQRGQQSETVFLRLGEGKHRIRLVGEWLEVKSHWIGNSKFNSVHLYPDSAFEGEDRLRKAVNCEDFDVETDSYKREHKCVICQLRSAANALRYDARNKPSKTEEAFLAGLAKACNSRDSFYFLCIDRDDPEIAPGKKGYKIVEFGKELQSIFCERVVSLGSDINVSGEDDGCDIVIGSTKVGNERKWSLDFVYKGGAVLRSPLTDEEKAMERPDMRKILCRTPDQAALRARLSPENREILDDYLRQKGYPIPGGANAAGDAGDDDSVEHVPF